MIDHWSKENEELDDRLTREELEIKKLIEEEKNNV